MADDGMRARHMEEVHGMRWFPCPFCHVVRRSAKTVEVAACADGGCPELPCPRARGCLTCAGEGILWRMTKLPAPCATCAGWDLLDQSEA